MTNLIKTKRALIAMIAATAFAIGLIATPATSQALTATGSLPITASVPDACTVATQNPVAFGSYTGSINLNTSGNVQLTCSVTLPYTVALDQGLNSSHATGTFPRAMSNGASYYLAYQLYTSYARGTIWGDGTSTTGTVAGTGIGGSTPDAISIFGTIPLGQNVAPGSYSDTVGITVTYS